jgi:hypothetical protein
MKKTKAVVVTNLIYNQCFYIIDDKYHEYKK